MIGRPQLGKSHRQTAKVTTVPAPTKGMDSRIPLSELGSSNCVYSYNLMAAEYGMDLRKGYREFAVNVVDSAPSALGVRTVIPFKGVNITGGANKIFVATNEGIFDVTDESIAPILAIGFTNVGGIAGYGVYCHYIDQAGKELLYYADEDNGLFSYDSESDTWAVPVGINNIAVENIVFVVVHKQRIWFVEKNSTTAWYLPVASVSGDATAFHFGSKFPHGGKLKGLYNWSVDGGAGVDDHLVAISSAGDVIPYKGDDPSTADTWGLVGTYFIGETPLGRSIANEYGGDLHIISVFGLVSMTDLLKGSSGMSMSQKGIGYQIAPLVRKMVQSTLGTRGFDMKFLPSLGVLVIVSPETHSEDRIQYVMNITTGGWTMWRGLEIDCIDEIGGVVYFGRKNNLYMMEGYLDNTIKINPPSVEFHLGEPVEFSLLTGFSRHQSDGMFKQIQFVRPDFLGVSSPTYTVKTIYDFNIIEIPQIPSHIAADANVWDIARWDIGIWQKTIVTGQTSIRGAATGIGRSAAIAIRGSANFETKLLSFDEIWTTGGAL